MVKEAALLLSGTAAVIQFERLKGGKEWAKFGQQTQQIRQGGPAFFGRAGAIVAPESVQEKAKRQSPVGHAGLSGEDQGSLSGGHLNQFAAEAGFTQPGFPGQQSQLRLALAGLVDRF